MFLTEEEYKELYLNKSFKRRIARYIDKMQRKVPFSLEKEDLIQDIFLRLWEQRDKFNPYKAPLVAWAAVVAVRTVSNHIRDEKLRLSKENPPDTLEVGLDDEGKLEPINEELSPEGRLESEHARDEILGAVNQLPKDLREVINLKLEGLNNQAISERLGISKDLVRKRLERARTRLKN